MGFVCSKIIATGYAVASISFGGYGLLLSLLGVLAGVTLMVRLRRNLAVVGLVVASAVITAVTGEESRALCFILFAALIVGISLITAGVLAVDCE